MANDAVFYQRDGHIGTITLNRPDNRNSMTPELLTAFTAASEQARTDRDARCIVIVGRGNCFSAGADFHAPIQGGHENAPPHEKSFAIYQPFLSVLEIEVPVLGALNGHAVGGGFGLALTCDIRIGTRNAKYGANFARLGLHPGMAISYLLPRLIGISNAAEMLFTGQLVLGDRAAELGIVSRAVDGEEVLPATMALAKSISEAAPNALRMTKRTFYDGLDWQPQRAAYREAIAQAQTIDTDESREGMTALLEKRTPRF